MSVYEEWINREIKFPENLSFTVGATDTVSFTFGKQYRVLSHVDSTGCVNCRLGLDQWKKLINEMDSLVNP